MERCPTCGRRRRRSNPANAAYWGLLHEIAETLRPNGQTFSAETYHEYYKGRFLGVTEHHLPNGDVLRIPKSTADLSIDEFSEFLTKVEKDAAARGVFMDEIV